MFHILHIYKFNFVKIRCKYVIYLLKLDVLLIKICLFLKKPQFEIKISRNLIKK